MKKRLILPALAVLVLLSASCKQRPPFLPEIPVEPVPDSGWNVLTDYSWLTPYRPANAMVSRLHDGPLPELIPSGDYGLLLPYAGLASTLDYGGIQVTKYGLVTMDGVIVTDVVYDDINIVYDNTDYSVSNKLKQLPAYRLRIDVSSEYGSEYREWRYAACALNGSWVTPFDYVNITFSRNTITLVREYDSTDIDVYSYSGKLLYNMKDLSWIGEVDIHELYGLTNDSDSEGYIAVRMNDGTVSFVNLLTGDCRRTWFSFSGGFSESLAAVGVGEYSQERQPLWGYINTDFEIVIDLSYDFCEQFVNGTAIVGTHDVARHLINKQGEVLLTVAGTAWIQRNYGGPGYTVIDYSDSSNHKHYTDELVEVPLVSTHGELVDTYHIGGGWYFGHCFEEVQQSADAGLTYIGPIGRVLISEKGEYLFSEATHIYQVVGEYMAYDREESQDGGSAGSGIMTLDGRDIITPEIDTRITIVTEGYDAVAFMVNTGFLGYYGRPSGHATPVIPTYKLVGMDGRVIASGLGTISQVEASDLFTVLADDSYSYLDRDGNTIISIPLISYMLD